MIQGPGAKWPLTAEKGGKMEPSATQPCTRYIANRSLRFGCLLLLSCTLYRITLSGLTGRWNGVHAQLDHADRRPKYEPCYDGQIRGKPVALDIRVIDHTFSLPIVLRTGYDYREDTDKFTFPYTTIKLSFSFRCFFFFKSRTSETSAL